MRAFKSSLRIAWKMGLVLRFVDLRIRGFHFKSCSCFQMEWLPFFCFICGALGPGVNHCAGIKGKSDCNWHFGIGPVKTVVFWGVFEKHGADCRGGSVEKRREEVVGVQHALMGACLVSLGMEHSIDSSNHRGLGGWSEMLSVVRPLSPVPPSVVHSCVSQRFSMMGMGFQQLSPVVQKLSSPKPTSKPSPKYEPISIPLCPMRGILKRVARAQEKKFQNFNRQAQEYLWALGFFRGCGV